MTATGPERANRRACENCRRRGWLLAELSASLDYRCRDRAQLIELLALGDEDLIQAVGGGRRAELQGQYAQLEPAAVASAPGVQAVCRHDRRYPRALTGAVAPPMLNVAGGVDTLSELTAGPVVAIVGTARATDYGIEMAKSLARGLAASAVAVTSGLTDGIAVAAHAGVLEGRGRPVAVMSGGLDVACPASRRSLYERIRRDGCAVAELPCGCPARRWGAAASERVIAGLGDLTVVVEADESPSELAGARIAQALGRAVAAVPGRVTSPASRGAHALLMSGAHLVRGPADALELLCGASAVPTTTSGRARTELEPRLKAILERVGAGQDTPDKLARDGADAGEVLLALSELELTGLLARGDGGRYVPRDVPPPSYGGRQSR